MKISGKTLWIIASMLTLSSCTGLLSQQQPGAEEIDTPNETPTQNNSAGIASQQQPQPTEEIAPPADSTDTKPEEQASAGIASQQQPQPTEEIEPHADNNDTKLEESGDRPARRGFSTLLGSTVLQEELKAEDVAQEEQATTEAPVEATEQKKEKKKLRNTHKATRPTPEQEAAAYRLLNNPESFSPEPVIPGEPERPTLRLRGYGATESDNESETGLPPMPNAVELRGLRSPGLRSGNLPMDINGKLMPINQR